MILPFATASQYWPHRKATFEGYYSKFNLPSGASLITVIFTVPRAPEKANSASITYIPADRKPIWQAEANPNRLDVTTTSNYTTFSLHTSDGGVRLSASESGVEYQVKIGQNAVFEAETSNRIPWSPSRASTFKLAKDSPEGLWTYLLFLPIHWHVHSIGSRGKVDLQLPSEAGLEPSDFKGEAIVHEEKNWGRSFPQAHIWVQAFEGAHDGVKKRGVCLAGGKTVGLEAFLIGYRNEKMGIEWDFRPPFALRMLGFSPWLEFSMDYEARTFCLCVQDLHHKLVIKAAAPKSSFFSLPTPFPDGARQNWLAQSLHAHVNVEAWERRHVFGDWRLVLVDGFENASLEFGGDYYPYRGTSPADI